MTSVRFSTTPVFSPVLVGVELRESILIPIARIPKTIGGSVLQSLSVFTTVPLPIDRQFYWTIQVGALGRGGTFDQRWVERLSVPGITHGSRRYEFKPTIRYTSDEVVAVHLSPVGTPRPIITPGFIPEIVNYGT